MLEDFIRQSILFSFTFLSTLFASVSGGGAGLIQFPLLIILGLPFSIALGTHKVAAVFLGIGAICKKGKQSTFSIDKTVALIMVLVGGSSVVLGSLLIVSIRTDIAQISLGLMIILCGFYSLIKKGFGSSKVKKRTIKRTLLGALTICIIGLFSGSLSSRAGLFYNHYFSDCFWTKAKKSHHAHHDICIYVLERNRSNHYRCSIFYLLAMASLYDNCSFFRIVSWN